MLTFTFRRLLLAIPTLVLISLIIFLLLGFGAGVLNVLRSAGMVADAGLKIPEKGDRKPDDE